MSGPASPAACFQCGAPLPEGSPMGLCPACLLRQGIGTQTAPTGAASGHPSFEPPTLDELSRNFPQLEIIQLIGQGGMGAVYKARQPALDRLVALKILPPQAAGRDPGFTERFNREARALARLSHPHIVHVHDFGQAGEYYYFLMEYVDGANLRQLEHAHRLTPREALAIVPQICEALQYAHDQGVVHRDIKPENILVSRQGQVKIADFGVAKIVGAEKSPITLTNAGQIMGTPLYMAPEQVEHPSEVDHRADIYSLGVVFYEMLTGELPLGRFAAPSRKVQIDVRLDEVVLRALEKEPGLRYQQAGEFKTEVETVASGPASAEVPVRMDKPTGLRRFSRTAIVGAAWVPCFFIAFVMMFTARAVQAGEYPGPAWWQIALAFTLLPVGFTAPFGTTILGWVAVGQIRRSAGRIYGMALALFDGLLFPLLALDVGLTFLIHALGVGFFQWSQEYSDKQNSQLIALSGIAWIVVDALIIWLVWRAMNPRPKSPASSAPPAASGKMPAPQPAVGLRWLRAALLTVAAVFLLLVVLSVGALLLAMFLPAHRRAQTEASATALARQGERAGLHAHRRAQTEASATAPAVHAVAHAPYTARLPYGATAELWAVSNPSEGDGAHNRLWWQPDGTVFNNAWFLTKGSHSYPSQGQVAREFLLQVLNLPPGADSWPVWKLDPPGSWAGGEVVRMNNTSETVDGMKMISTTLPESARSVNVRVGFGLGPWETVSEQAPGGSETASGSRNGRSWTISFLPAAEANGSTKLTAIHNIRDEQVRLIAIDNAGGEHFSMRTEGGGSEAFNHTIVTFTNLPLAQVKEFRFQVRPYSWAEFRNVSLNPNQKTQVSVVDAAEPVASQTTISVPAYFKDAPEPPVIADAEPTAPNPQTPPQQAQAKPPAGNGDQSDSRWTFFPDIGAMSRQLADAQIALAELRSHFGESHPMVQETAASVAALARRADAKSADYVDELKKKLAESEAEQERLGAEFSAKHPLMLTVRARIATIQSLLQGQTPDSASPNPAQDDQRQMLELQLKQAQAEADRVESQQKAGIATARELQEAKDKVEILRAQIDGNPVHVAEVKLAAANRQVDQLEKLAAASAASQSEVDKAKNERDQASLQLQQAQARSSEAPSPAPPAP